MTWVIQRRCCATSASFVRLGQRLIRRGIIPQDDGWSGWLGRYQKALRDAVTILETPSVTKQSERDKNRDLGR